jgi:hypothetical protein
MNKKNRIKHYEQRNGFPIWTERRPKSRKALEEWNERVKLQKALLPIQRGGDSTSDLRYVSIPCRVLAFITTAGGVLHALKFNTFHTWLKKTLRWSLKNSISGQETPNSTLILPFNQLGAMWRNIRCFTMPPNLLCNELHGKTGRILLIFLFGPLNVTVHHVSS